MPGVGIRAAKGVDRVGEQRPRREEARRPFRVPVEVADAEARVARVREVLRPRELGDQLPELAVDVAARVDLDVARPHSPTCAGVLVNIRERVPADAHAAVEEQHVFSLRNRNTPAARVEATTVRLRDRPDRQTAGDGVADDAGAAVLRAVVDEDELGIEPASFHRRDERVDRLRELSGLVVDRHDDAQGRCSHEGEP